MVKRTFVSRLFRFFWAFLSCQTAVVCAATSKSTVPGAALVRDKSRDLPVLFEENRGQAGSEVKFFLRGRNHVLFLTPAGVGMGLFPERAGGWLPRKLPVFWGLIPPGGTRTSQITAGPATASYSGIDLFFCGNEGRLEYDFVVSPGADPGRIRWKFRGVESLGSVLTVSWF